MLSHGISGTWLGGPREIEKRREKKKKRKAGERRKKGREERKRKRVGRKDYFICLIDIMGVSL